MKIAQLIGFILIGFLVITFADGCSEKQSPTELQTHPVGWNETTSELFHSAKVRENGDVQTCTSCHGDRFDEGGQSGVSCTQCHNSGQVESVMNHPERIREKNWDLSECTICHGTDFSGMAGSANCAASNCHARDDGPKACNTCHGDFSATDRTGMLTDSDMAPPKDLNDGTKQSDLGVGLHPLHVQNWPTCENCHPAVTEFDDPDHIDGDDIAELNIDSDKGIRILSWNREQATCTSSCHIRDGKPFQRKWTIP